LLSGLSRAKSTAMGEKKEAVTLEFRKSRESGKSLHFAYVKQQHIA
jgi:hypothetical protein